MSIFDRIDVMNGWRDAPHYWWRYLLLPFAWEKCPPLGYTVFQFFGFAIFWHQKLSAEQERQVLANSRKVMQWAREHGKKID